MGKLHTLRRAIERNPESWFYHVRWNNTVKAIGAEFYRGVWKPIYGWDKAPYRSFVRYVLHDLGYIVE